MRKLAKRAAEGFLARSGVASLGRRRGRDRTLVLAYHNVVPSGDPPMGDMSLHMPLARFKEHLDVLEESFHVVSVAEAMEPGERGTRPRVCITFDDGYRGALTLGLMELARRGLPVTVFVCPGLLEEEGFWWDRVADPDLGAVPPSIRKKALSAFRGRQDAVKAFAQARGRWTRPLPHLYRPASREELISAAALPGVHLGSHTWSHPNLAALTDDEVRVEILRPREWLTETVETHANLLTYPYGSTNAAVMSAAGNLGLEGAFLISGGFADRKTVEETPYAIPRMNVPRGLSPEGLLVRASGVWP